MESIPHIVGGGGVGAVHEPPLLPILHVVRERPKSEGLNTLRAITSNYSIGSVIEKVVPWPSALSTSMVPECCSMMA